MSFSTTLYRISEFVFHQLETNSIKANELVTKSKSYVTFQNSMDALQFILKKRADAEDSELIKEIVLPAQSLGSVSEEYFKELIESCNYKELDRISASTYYFLPPGKVIRLNAFFATLDKLKIRELYDPHELNSNNIYPSIWTSGEETNEAYNLFHLQDEFTSLKIFFASASADKDYVLSFSG
jgi:hypothetical protein